MAHPYSYTLDLLKHSVDKAPQFFPAERRLAMHAEVEKLAANPKTPVTEIERMIVAFGREIWPYRRAFAKIHDAEGRVREDRYLQEELEKRGMKEKYLNFLAKGARVEDIRQGGNEFEIFFSSDERALIVEAKLAVHDRVSKEIQELCLGSKNSDCLTFIEQFKKEQVDIERRITAFAGLAERSEKWGPEIRGKVKMFEEGWSGVEHDVTKEGGDGEIEDYRGVIELFE